MKRFAQAVLVIAIVLVTASAGLGQDHFQTGDVFAGIGGGQIQWYRNGTLLHTLSTTTNSFDTGMAFDAAGNLYSTNFFNPGSVSKFDTSGNLLPGTFGSGYNFDPESILFDSAGNAYVGQADGTHQVLKFSSTGSSAGTFSPTIENRGTDWIDLAADQKTLFYTSEGHLVKRFDVSVDGGQLSDFATGLPGAAAFALRILPNGNVLVADSSAVLQLNTSGSIIHTYSPCDGPCGGLFSLNLDPDGLHFWVGDSSTGIIYKIRIADAGAVIDQTISTGSLALFGVVVFGEITSSNTSNLVFSPSATPETQIATIGNPTDPAAQSLALTLASVTNPINVSVTFFYEPTDVSTKSHGVGIADGICENGATEATDFDCRFTVPPPDFTYPAPLLPAGDKLVPHIIPSHNDLGVWVRVIATLVSNGMPAVAGTDYNRNGGDVEWAYAWNTNPQLFSPTPNPDYSPGWNNLNPQMYDRPGSNPDIAFIFNITTFSKFNCNPTCVGTADPVTGGKTPTLNDIVVAAPPNPPTGSPDTVELLVPVPGSSPFQYLKSLPMLVSFELENESSEKSDPTALTPPHSVSVATLDPNGNPIPVQHPARFPTTFTYSSFFKTYYIFLSPAPYTVGTVYTLQIDSDLLPQPVNRKFVVKNFQF